MGAVHHRGRPRARAAFDVDLMTSHGDQRRGAVAGRPATARSARAWAVLLVVLAAALAIDLWSKDLAFARVAGAPVIVRRDAVLEAGPRHLARLVPPHQPRVVVPDALELTLVLNPGAIFGIGAGRRWVFVAFTALAIVFAVGLFVKWTRPRDWPAHAGLGLILAGGLGNLHDRLRFACVRDFLHPLPNARLPWGWTWPGGGRAIWPYVSNLADLFLIIGVLALFVHAMRHPGAPADTAHPQGPRGATPTGP